MHGLQRQTGISVSYRKHRYQGLWYQYRSRLGHFLGLGISIGIGRAICISFWVICNNSLLSKVSVSVSVLGYFPGISISISVSIQTDFKYWYQYGSRFRASKSISISIVSKLLVPSVSAPLLPRVKGGGPSRKKKPYAVNYSLPPQKYHPTM